MAAIFSMPLSWITGLLGAAFIASVASVFSSVLVIFSTVFSALGPVFTAISQAVVWFVKEFFAGLQVILTNLSTLAVLIVAVVVSGLYINRHDAKDCRAEVALQKRADYAHFAYLQPKPAAPAATRRVVAPRPKPKAVRAAPPPSQPSYWPF